MIIQSQTHQERTQDHLDLANATLTVLKLKKKYHLEGKEVHMKKVTNALNKQNFNFAWGADNEGEELKKFVLNGVKRHDFDSVAKYVRYCIRETSLREQKEK